MDERELRELIAEVKDGRLSRRAFVQQMIAVGLTAPMAGMMLSQSGVAFAATEIPYKPTRAGGGGPLKLLYWQAPTLLNPHFAVGTKDQEACRAFYEPLAGWDGDGNLVPALAAEIPSTDNDGLKEDGLSVVWKLKRGVKWHDGAPFTADDVVFNWEYARNPETAAVTVGSYKDLKVEKLDDYTVRMVFAEPTPFWAEAFVGSIGMIIPKHLFADYVGAKSRDAPANLKPVGTGPYMFVDFKPGDIVLGKRNPGLSPAQSAPLRHAGNQGRRRRGFGRACGAADRRIRLCLEHAGRGRDSAEAGSRRQGQAVDCFGRQHRVHPAQLHRSFARGGRRAFERQNEESAVLGPGGARSDQPPDRSRLGAEVHLRANGRGNGKLPQQPRALQVEKHQLRVQYREGQSDPRGGGVEEGAGRHSHEGRQTAQVRVPDVDQRAARKKTRR